MSAISKPVAAATAASEIMDRPEAAKYLGLSEQTLASWACTGRHSLPFVRLGRRVKYRKSDLDAYLASHTVNGATTEEAAQ
ncbi:helix-turn-helix domain-containing protein [Methylococcus sp. EFPC2]|uniref:helix-turn-helix domain-containing protein n=1 Tax=Methylococcus sp. EFPC2 TaxID=2812648 RepID=UPI0019684417|nr:helix-turn-helix domain-containing protein [Methylococcus sp. EFPC2]QSA97122.1 helix-turn-helix domain-containing protein [Methylococcus sp. EFPC2]